MAPTRHVALPAFSILRLLLLLVRLAPPLPPLARAAPSRTHTAHARYAPAPAGDRGSGGIKPPEAAPYTTQVPTADDGAQQELPRTHRTALDSVEGADHPPEAEPGSAASKQRTDWQALRRLLLAGVEEAETAPAGGQPSGSSGSGSGRSNGAGGGGGGGAGSGGAGGSGARSGPLFAPAPSALTFDGFPFGFGGLSVSTAGSVDDLLVRAFFNRLFGIPFYGYVSQALPNQLTRPIDLLPPPLRARLDRQVFTPVGYDLLDRLVDVLVNAPTATAGTTLTPGGCIGPVYSVGVLGGNCTFGSSSAAATVTCTQPSLRLTASPLTCNLPYRAGCSLRGLQLRKQVPLGPTAGGYLGPAPGVYEAGVSVNITRVWLGYNFNSRRILNDFGVIRWYAELVQFLSFELTRVANALIVPPPPATPPSPPTGNGTGNGTTGGGVVGGGGGTSGGGGATGGTGTGSTGGGETPTGVGGGGAGGAGGGASGGGGGVAGGGGGGGSAGVAGGGGTSGGASAGTVGGAATSTSTRATVSTNNAPSAQPRGAGGGGTDGIRAWTRPHVQPPPPPSWRAASAAGLPPPPQAPPDNRAAPPEPPGASLEDVASLAAALAGWRSNATLRQLLAAHVLGNSADGGSSGGGGGGYASGSAPSGSPDNADPAQGQGQGQGLDDSKQFAAPKMGDVFNMRGDTPDSLVGVVDRDASGKRVVSGSAQQAGVRAAQEQALQQQLAAAAAARQGGAMGGRAQSGGGSSGGGGGMWLEAPWLGVRWGDGGGGGVASGSDAGSSRMGSGEGSTLSVLQAFRAAIAQGLGLQDGTAAQGSGGGAVAGDKQGSTGAGRAGGFGGGGAGSGAASDRGERLLAWLLDEDV